MPAKDQRVDAYIANAADFAQPILAHLRQLVHTACPAVEETVKWGGPFFMHKGIVCFMAAFKAHCAFGFWKRKLIFDGEVAHQARGHFGRITSLADLPWDRELLGLIRKAVALNEAGVKLPPRRRSGKRTDLVVPEYFQAALKRNQKAATAFAEFSYSHKKEYVDWITEAKRDETRQKRIATALQWIASGKARNWKYESC